MKKIHRIFENFIEPYGLCRERDIKPIPSIDTPWLRKKLNKRKRRGKRK